MSVYKNEISSPQKYLLLVSVAAEFINGLS